MKKMFWWGVGLCSSESEIYKISDPSMTLNPQSSTSRNLQRFAHVKAQNPLHTLSLHND